MDAAVATSRSPSGPTSSTPSCEHGRRALHPRRGAPRRVRARARRRRRGSARCTGAELVGRTLHAAVPVLRRHARTRSTCSPATSSAPRTAPASCTWRPASARTTRRVCDAVGIPTSCPIDEHGRFTPRCPPYAGHARLRRQPGRSSSDLKARGVVVRHETYDHAYPHCWRTGTPLIYKAISSWFVQVTAITRPDGRAEPADHLGARARPGRQLRQVARQRPRLEHQPQPLLGLADPGVAAATTRRTRASTSTARSPSSSATSACGPTDLHRPYVDDLVRPEPRRPDRASR